MPVDHTLHDITQRWGAVSRTLQANRPLHFAVRTAALLVVFVIFQESLERATRLYESRYFEPFLFIQFLDRIGWPLIGISAVAAGLMIRFGHLTATWSDFEHGRLLRNLTGILTLLIAWPFVTISYNHYFDQSYLLDRGLLAALATLVWWRPAFLLLFLPQLSLLLGQLIEPALGGSVLAHKLQVSRALGLVGAAVVVHAVTRQRTTGPLVFLLVCFVAAQYWIPALAKLSIGWLASDELHLMPLVAHTYGWLDFLSSAQVIQIAQFLEPLDPLLRAAVIAVEGSCLFLLWRRGLARWLLGLAIAFHVGVFALGGLLFWTWMALDAGVLVLLLSRKRWPQIHTRTAFITSLVLILGADYWARPPHLGWYITPLSYVYQLDATLADGKAVPLAPAFFAPYEDVFATAAFAYAVTQHGVLVSTHGVTRELDVVKGLRNASTPAEVFALESGRSRYHAERREQLFNFLTRFASNVNRTGAQLTWLQRVQPPKQNYANRRGSRLLAPNTIEELILTERTFFYDGETLSMIREVEVARLPIPRGADHD